MQKREHPKGNNNFRPLPEHLMLLPSSVDGLGLFTSIDLSQGEITEVSHIKMDGHMYRTSVGGFVNHSDSANCELVLCDAQGNPLIFAADISDICDEIDKAIFRIRLTEDIKAGEELTLDYRKAECGFGYNIIDNKIHF